MVVQIRYNNKILQRFYKNFTGDLKKIAIHTYIYIYFSNIKIKEKNVLVQNTKLIHKRRKVLTKDSNGIPCKTEIVEIG